MKRFSNILLMVGDDADLAVALPRTLTLAKNNHARVTLVDVVEAIPAGLQMAITAVTPEELCAIAAKEKQERLDSIIASLADQGVAIQARVLVGKPAIEVIRQVLRDGHDLIVKCVDADSGLRSMVFGSTDMHLLRKCPCPIWILKSTEHVPYRRILAAVDQDLDAAVDDGLNRQILEMSTSLALAESSELHVVHAWRLFAESYLRSPRLGLNKSEVDTMVDEEGRARRRWIKHLLSSFGTAVADAVDHLKPDVHVVQGDPKRVVPDTVREFDIDLVVMGTVARTGIAGYFIGNTAETILAQIDCSVLTVKPVGFVSPVALDA